MNISTKLNTSKIITTITALFLYLLLNSFGLPKETESYSLTVNVSHLRNSKGVVQFSIYNKDGTIPDEKFKKYYRQKKIKITNKTATVTFYNLPKGTYAINLLHDENKNGKVDKGWILPIEGLGFSNFKKLGLMNRPNFKKASFELNANLTKTVKTIYM